MQGDSSEYKFFRISILHKICCVSALTIDHASANYTLTVRIPVFICSSFDFLPAISSGLFVI